MTTIQPLSRRNFLQMSAMAAGSCVALSVLGKGAMALEAAPKLSSQISNNHGHALVLSLEQLVANGAKKYNIKGTSGHSHELAITPQILATLQKTKIVDVDSGDGAGHFHVVRLQII